METLVIIQPGTPPYEAWSANRDAEGNALTPHRDGQMDYLSALKKVFDQTSGGRQCQGELIRDAAGTIVFSADILRHQTFLKEIYRIGTTNITLGSK